MNIKDGFGRLTGVIACFSMLVPWTAVVAAPPENSRRVVEATAAPSIDDVSLGQDGRLSGQLVSATHKAKAQTPVVIIRRGRVVARTQTDAQGRFAVTGLSGGLYEIEAPDARRAVRLWAPGTAPPAAQSAITLTASPLVVRGQYQPGPMVRFIEYTKYPLAHPLVFGGIVGASVAIPVAIHNRNKGSGS